jgi:drug/metabolite transporter (DMT)-like permease
LTTRRRAELILLVITIIWGSTFVVTKSILVESTPLFYSGVRFILSALILLIFFSRTCLTWSPLAFKHGTVLGLLLYFGFILQTIGINYTSASKAAFFTGMLVPFTPIVQLAPIVLWPDLNVPSSCEWHWITLPALSVQSSPMLPRARSVR